MFVVLMCCVRVSVFACLCCVVVCLNLVYLFFGVWRARCVFVFYVVCFVCFSFVVFGVVVFNVVVLCYCVLFVFVCF